MVALLKVAFVNFTLNEYMMIYDEEPFAVMLLVTKTFTENCYCLGSKPNLKCGKNLKRQTHEYR